MELIIIVIFVLGYLMITLEHPLRIDKAAPALLLGVITWALYALMGPDYHEVVHELEHHLPEIVNILFFLMGAMTIVELIDIHDGFQVITSRINTKNKRKLLYIISVLSFFLSAALDNLTTAIVMASLLRKLIKDKTDRLWFASMVVISANAGGAWSPIGDVTTTMLWIGNNISAGSVIVNLIIPSMVCMIVPMFLMGMRFKGEYDSIGISADFKTTPRERYLILIAGVSCLIFVPVFKTITHLPPFMGMFFGVGVMWLITEILHKTKSHSNKEHFSVINALSKIDTASILFFFGILAGVGCLSSIGTLRQVAEFLDNSVGNYDVIVMITGVLSSIVDNVPLVAAAMKMYDIVTPEMIEAGNIAAERIALFETDGKFWEFLAYCAGTGGSMLIIGSAAGVAIMGIERIEFFWYLKNIAWLAFVGYVAGAITYLVMYNYIL